MTRAHREVRGGQECVGLVLQDVFLFAGTVRENLALGRPSATEDRLRAAVAEQGVTLSSGERQLLAFARALAGEPGIVVLDEATANVDTETERRIQQGIREANRILVFHHGAIRESGTHEEFLALGGIYARLYRLQFGLAS